MPIKDLIRRRLEWYEHVCRREEDDDIRKVLEMHMYGARARGRPKQRWSDTVRADLRWLGLEREDTENRIRWRSLVDMMIRQKPATRTGHGGERSIQLVVSMK